MSIRRFEAEKHLKPGTILEPRPIPGGPSNRAQYTGYTTLSDGTLVFFIRSERIPRNGEVSPVWGNVKGISYHALTNGYDLRPHGYKTLVDRREEKSNGTPDKKSLLTRVEELEQTVARLVERLGGID